MTKMKDSAVKQELEKNDELVRSTLRAVATLSHLPEVESNSKFEGFIKTIKGSEHASKYETILLETKDASDAMDTS